MVAIFVMLVVILLCVSWAIAIHNRQVALRNRFKNAFMQIDVQLKRRHDLIPNLVETAKGYMRHEHETLEAVIAARSYAVAANAKAAVDPADAAAMRQMAAAEGALNATVGRLFGVSEAYPDLKANQTMMQLSEELTGTENRIAFARQAYNDNVMEYNTAIEQFPASLIAGMSAFRNAELLRAIEAQEERKAVKVTF